MDSINNNENSIAVKLEILGYEEIAPRVIQKKTVLTITKTRKTMRCVWCNKEIDEKGCDCRDRTVNEVKMPRTCKVCGSALCIDGSCNICTLVDQIFR